MKVTNEKATLAAYMRKWTSEKREQGICVGCGSEPALPNKRKCQPCYDKWNGSRAILRQARKQEGVCSECGRPSLPGMIRCEKHWIENRDSVLRMKGKRLADGLCTRCGQNPFVPGIQTCTTCCLKYFAHDLWKDRSRWQELLDLFNKQGRRCRYTGRDLTIGQQASIDHIIPVSKGGTNDIGNLQWVDLYVNKMKLDKSEVEFIDTVMEIAKVIAN